MTTTRRLAAILAADVAGYSRLMGTDEEGTLNRLRSIRTKIIGPKIAEHRGRIVKTKSISSLPFKGLVHVMLRACVPSDQTPAKYLPSRRET